LVLLLVFGFGCGWSVWVLGDNVWVGGELVVFLRGGFSVRWGGSVMEFVRVDCGGFVWVVEGLCGCCLWFMFDGVRCGVALMVGSELLRGCWGMWAGMWIDCFFLVWEVVGVLVGEFGWVVRLIVCGWVWSSVCGVFFVRMCWIVCVMLVWCVQVCFGVGSVGGAYFSFVVVAFWG